MLLKLLCVDSFACALYSERERLASGAYATVYSCPLGAWSAERPAAVALKVIDRSNSARHFCPFPDVFSEVSILSRLRQQRGICHMFDFGVSRNAYYIVMRRYESSLRNWRVGHGVAPPSASRLRTYLHIYRNVLLAVQRAAEHGVIHYDLKCDNVLLRSALPGEAGDAENCEVALADFGVGRILGDSQDLDLRNRGTECIKSPEMIIIASSSDKQHDAYDRRKKEGTSRASDVWSLGCLFFELVAGRFLFNADNAEWTRFFLRVTREDAGEELLRDEDRESLGQDQEVVKFLEFVLVRDPMRRPQLNDVITRFDRAFGPFPKVLESPAVAAKHTPGTPGNVPATGTVVGFGPQPSRPPPPVLPPPPSPLAAPRQVLWLEREHGVGGDVFVGSAMGVGPGWLRQHSIGQVVVVTGRAHSAASAAEWHTLCESGVPVMHLSVSEFRGEHSAAAVARFCAGSRTLLCNDGDADVNSGGVPAVAAILRTQWLHETLYEAVTGTVACCPGWSPHAWLTWLAVRPLSGPLSSCHSPQAALKFSYHSDSVTRD